MNFYQILLKKKLGYNRNLSWYWNLFADFVNDLTDPVIQIFNYIPISQETSMSGQIWTPIDGGYHISGQATKSFNVGEYGSSYGTLLAGHQYYFRGIPDEYIGLDKAYYFMTKSIDGKTTTVLTITSNGIYTPSETIEGGRFRIYFPADVDMECDLVPQVFDVTGNNGRLSYPLKYYPYNPPANNAKSGEKDKDWDQLFSDEDFKVVQEKK